MPADLDPFRETSLLFDLIRERGSKSDIASASSQDEWEQVFSGLEAAGPFVASAAECPYFVVSPPVLEPKDRWLASRDPSIDEATWQRLTERSFMPLDRAYLQRKALIDIVEVSRTPATHPLVDVDYGMVLTPGGRMRNFTLDYSHLFRVQRLDRHYIKFPSAIFSIGAHRARALLNLPSSEPWNVPEFDIRDRSQLDEVIGKLQASLGSNTEAQIWFRGQNRDILLDSSLRNEPLCPWRNTTDSSLVPSLYRNTWHGGDLRAYAEKLSNVQRYVSFVGHHLNIRPYTTRDSDETPVEKLPDEWSSYAPSFSSHQVDGDGKHLSTKDYHHAFDGLQRSFFLQHYGLPSNILDITKDIDIALFFAQNKSDVNQRIVPAQGDESVIFVFILLPGLDRFLDSTPLSERYGLLRPARQQCGLLCGASFVNRNHYARYIALKLRLRERISYTSHVTAEYVYPPRSEDSFLDVLLNFSAARDSDVGDVLPHAPNFGA